MSKRITPGYLRELADRIEDSADEPIKMILHCPDCHCQHIDKPTNSVCGAREVNDAEAWTNPPHRSHKCEGCGVIWRPADVYTEGVATIETQGRHDTWANGKLLDYSLAEVALSRRAEGGWDL